MKWIKNGLYYGILILLIVVATATIKSRIFGEQPSLFGYHFLNVISGSMSPTINKGSLIIVQEIDGIDVLPQDVITFKSDSQQLTTHRVIEVQNHETLQFVTKGDANEVIDPMSVTESQLVGRVVFYIPYIGGVIETIQQQPIIFIMMLVAGGIISASLKYLLSQKTEVIKSDQI